MSAESRPSERAALTAAIVSAYAIGYFALGWSTDPARARTLSTRLDTWIPFVPETVLLYGTVYTAVTLPLFVVRSAALFRRVALAYAVVIGVSLTVFAAFPVSSTTLRPAIDTLDATRFTQWAVRLVYSLDPPFNLFPSIHLSISTLAACSAWQARRSYGAIAFVWLAAIAVSICTVKQHYVADGVAGLALAAGAHWRLIRPHRAGPREAVAFGWGGPALYLLVNSLFYASFYLAFRFDAAG